MATYYWVGGSGTWDNSNTANWSTSSGGAGGAGPPTSSDTAFINTASYASSFTITLSATASADIVYIANTNVTVQQSGNLTSLNNLYLYGGTYDANNYNLTAVGFIMASGVVSGVTVSGPRTITMGSGTWAIKTWTALSSNTTFNKNTANISFRAGSLSVFTGGGFTYNKITFTEATSGSGYTYAFDGSSTFTEVASLNTVAFTIRIGSAGNATLSTYSWTASGTAGNVITINSLSQSITGTLIKLGGGYIAGVDYISVGNVITATPTDTWYFGSNSTFVIGGTTASRPNRTTGIFNTVRSQNAVVVLTSTSSATWTVPLDWNNTQNTIHLFGGGGGGGGGYASSSIYGGGGGGGGGYTKLTNQNLSLGASITYQAGTGGAAGAAATNGSSGGTTSWNSGASTAGGGGGGSRSSTGGTAGTGSTYNGGVGGAGGVSTVGNTSSGGGGAGAGGPNGTGGDGGSGVSNAAVSNSNGGGGGGSGGGGTGANATTSGAAVGGNNFSGVGGGTVVAMSGSQGGGSAGAYYDFPFNSNSSGGNGIDIFGTGSGGGLGGRAYQFSPITTLAKGGSYGGGGGGGFTDGSTDRQGFDGGQGAIVLVYTPVNRGNFLAFFEP
jgi:hypothetical protein